MATTPDLPRRSTEPPRREVRGVGQWSRERGVTLAACAVLAVSACSPAQDERETFPRQTPASASKLSTTVTAPAPITEPTTPEGVAVAFLSAYAGGDTRQACRYATSELKRDLGTETGNGCNNQTTMERLPEITLLDSCPVPDSATATQQVRFHVVPGAGQYRLLVYGEPQDLLVRLREDYGSYDVTERPSATDPTISCAQAVPTA